MERFQSYEDYVDVDKAEMELSESDSKFIRNECIRRTVQIKSS